MKNLDAFIVADDNICFTKGPVTRPSPVVSARGGASAAAVRMDLETTGTFIACAASAVNFATERPDFAREVLTALPQWLPTAPASVRSAQLALLQEDLPVAVCGSLRDLGLHLRIAIRATRRHCHGVASGATLPAGSLDDLVSLWGLLCERTMAIFQLLKPLAPFLYPTAELNGEAEAGCAERLLAAASLGHWPCISRSGAITMPGWIERRSERRHVFNMDCRIVEADRDWMAQIVDISLTGVGLRDAPPLDVGTRAALVVGSLADLHGEVIWSNGKRLGFRFDTPLDSLADLGRRLMSG
ncbi:MAG: PilZ domain-containing protein [Hyphomicrobiaceae bacterium]